MKKKIYIEDIEKDLKRPNGSKDIPAPELTRSEIEKDPVYRDIYAILKKNMPKKKSKK